MLVGSGLTRLSRWWMRAVLPAALAALVPAPAGAQVDTSVVLGGARLSVTSDEMAALGRLASTLPGSSPQIQDSALAAARRAAKGRDARYWLALLELELGRLRKDDVLRAQALDLLIPSDMTTRETLAGYLDVRGGIAFRARDFAIAKAHWTRLLGLRPNDPDVLANLAQVHVAQGDPAGAQDLLQRAIGGREESGKRPTAAWYRQRLAIAQQAGLAGPGAAAGRALVAAYPTPEHWRNALIVYRQLAAPTGALEIDLLRLTRAVGALARTDEYLRMAQLLRIAGQAAEAKAVLAEGLARGLLDPGTSPTREIIAEVDRAVPQERSRLAGARGPAPASAESLVSAGRYDEAVALYRAALARDGADAGEINSRLGTALVQANRRAEAEAAFRAATAAGRYADLAQFWLIRLAQAPAR